MEIKISKKAIDFIVSFEITNAAYYSKNLQHPTWPKGESGVTIGIGSDLGMMNAERIKFSWHDYVSPKDLSELIKCAGITGVAAKEYLQSNSLLRQVAIPYEIAYKQFIEIELPKAIKDTAKIYPHLNELLPDAIGGLVSMVYNRGNSLNDSKKSLLNKTYSRKEMRAIVPLVANKDYNAIAEQIEASKRLWVGIGMNGLVDRREGEASLVRGAIRQYSQDELVEVNA